MTVPDVFADSRVFSVPTVTTFEIEPSVVVSTGSGFISIDSVFSAGLRATSATGSLHLSSAASVCVQAIAACGLVEASTGGSGPRLTIGGLALWRAPERARRGPTTAAAALSLAPPAGVARQSGAAVKG